MCKALKTDNLSNLSSPSMFKKNSVTPFFRVSDFRKKLDNSKRGDEIKVNIHFHIAIDLAI